MNHFDENDFKRLAFDYVRGDLNEEDATAIENRMVDSPAYREYVQRIDSMIGAARKSPPEAEQKIDADSLFSRIESSIRAEDQPPVVVHFSDVSSETVDSRRNSLIWPALAMAAALVLFGVWFATSQMSDTTITIPQPGVATVDTSEAVVVAVAEPRISVEPVDSPDPDVQIFASKDAKFEMDGKFDKRLVLEDGTLLVEFIPDSGVRLSVQGKSFEVRVVGTIFYASTDGEGLVGVVAGEVLVTPETGGPVSVKAGQEYVVGEGVRSANTDRLAEANLHVDVERHLDLLAARRVVKDAPIIRRKVVEPGRLAPEHADLRNAANQLIRQGDVEGGAAMLEKLLRMLDANEPAAGSIRLDLARIYLRRLNRPQQAAIHLKRFVATRPNDAATPLARSEYCRILSSGGRTDELCP
jgi:hypothetical protein